MSFVSIDSVPSLPLNLETQLKLRQSLALIIGEKAEELNSLSVSFPLMIHQSAYADISKARALLGWKPATLSEGLSKTITISAVLKDNVWYVNFLVNQ